MTEEQNVTLKQIIQSFKYWPRVFRLLWVTDQKSLSLILLLNVVAGVLPALILIGNQRLINSVTYSWDSGFGVVIVALVVLTALFLIQLMNNLLREYTSGIFRQKLTYKVNVLLMGKSTNLSLSDFENDATYDKLQRAQNEANHRPYQIFESILSIITNFITLISTATILILWKWWIIFIILFIPICSSISFLKLGKKEFDVEWKRAPFWRKSWYLSYVLTKDITFKEVKLNNLGSYLLEQYRNIYSEFFKVDKKLIGKRTRLSLFFQSINQFIVAGLMLLVLYSTFLREILIGNMVSYIQAISSTQSSSQALLQQVFSMYQHNLYIEQLFSFLDVKEERQDDKTSTFEALYSIQSIEFKNVSFKYPGSENYALKNVSFTVHQNDTIAIVGKNGSGKSTLVKLLTRLYETDEGVIYINSIPISNYSPVQLREKIGVVFQDFVKYELTARENIGFGDVRSLQDNSRLNQAMDQSGAKETIESLPYKLDSQLGKWFSNGNQLSGGQWQKIAIARAIVKEADLYILDEPSSALDPAAENEVFSKFYDLTSNKIGIYISHRFSTVKKASKIFVFDEGAIVESGNHYELLNKNGNYAQLYNIQASAFVTDEEEQLVRG